MDEGAVMAAIDEQRHRGLLVCTKFMSEMLLSLPEQQPQPQQVSQVHITDRKYHAGKAYFDCKEYLRCFHLLQHSKCSVSRFLALYALFLSADNSDAEEKSAQLVQLKSLVDIGSDAEGDAYLLYLKSIVLSQLGNKPASIEYLARTVSKQPLLWSAWDDLANSSGVSESQQELPKDLVALDLPRDHPMYSFFLVRVYNLLGFGDQALQVADQLLEQFPRNVFARTQRALALYARLEFEGCEDEFQQMWNEDPYRVDDMDIFSNVLYVREEKPALSFLAHQLIKTDKYRPETCCVVGNYYSMRGEHTQAVAYFKRALKLDPQYMSAWTLMGHEYMELSNAVAAIHCYRRAVDLSGRDFRAWYALGQAYEIIQMPLYALWYFRKAASLRPRDARMWVALGGCFETLKRTKEAIRAYERALSAGDREGLASKKLALLHNTLGERDRAAYYYKVVLDVEDAHHREGNETVQALLYLATHCLQTDLLKEAESYCFRLLDFAGPEMMEAKSLLKIIQKRLADAK